MTFEKTFFCFLASPILFQLLLSQFQVAKLRTYVIIFKSSCGIEIRGTLNFQTKVEKSMLGNCWGSFLGDM